MTKADKLVLKIHNEVDTAEARILKQCDDILKQNNIVAESDLERKATLMRELGFVNSETVKKYEVIETKNKEYQSLKTITKEKADYIRELKVRYPLEKFLTIEELDRICSKYKLIHAPVANYIKDVPEKNVLEMKKAKPLECFDEKKPVVFYQYKGEFQNNAPIHIIRKLRSGFEISIDDKGYTNSVIARKYLGALVDYCWLDRMGKKFQTVEYNGFFIAAPKTHFKLDGLTKKGKFGFFNITVTEVKDPIVFQYCKNGVVRIITKWGTSDDQSYLDPSLTNEIQN